MEQEKTDLDLRKLQRRRNKGFIIGILLMISLIPLIIFVYLFQPLNPFQTLIVFSLIFLLPIVGVFYLLLVGATAGFLVRSVYIFQQIELDQLVISPRFVLAQKNDIYMLSLPKMTVIYFIRFRTLLETDQKRLQLPKIYWLWQMKDKLGDLRLAKREQVCTIPISEDKFGTGDAVVYYVDVRPYRGLFGDVMYRKHLRTVRSMHSDSNVLLMLLNSLQQEFLSF
ncbi:MAG: hypothetical protein ACFFCZ_15845 [Promethearchaeota archaeon]